MLRLVKENEIKTKYISWCTEYKSVFPLYKRQHFDNK